MRERIDDSRDDVQAEKHERHQGEVPMQAGGQKGRPAGGPDSQGRKDSKHDDSAHEDEGDRAGPARCVPEEGVAHWRISATRRTLPPVDWRRG